MGRQAGTPHFAMMQHLNDAMHHLRKAEDIARLELPPSFKPRDRYNVPLLATRIREIHESLTDDVLNGTTYRKSAYRDARAYRKLKWSHDLRRWIQKHPDRQGEIPEDWVLSKVIAGA